MKKIVKGENDEKDRRERNYTKLKNAVAATLTTICNLVNEDAAGINKIYKNKIVNYENTDDNYKKKAQKFYNANAAWYDHIVDGLRKDWDVIRGAGKGLWDLVKGAWTLVVLANPVTVTLGTLGIGPKFIVEPVQNTEKMLATLFTDPQSLVEGLGQAVTDGIDEEGAYYAVGYTLPTIALIIATSGAGGAGEAAEGAEAAEAAAAAEALKTALKAPSECEISPKQFGKKWGKHKFDYPGVDTAKVIKALEDGGLIWPK